jgi:hypothetical protein
MKSKHHKLSILRGCRIGPNAAIAAVKLDHSKISEFHTWEQADAALHWAVDRQVCRR